MPRMKILKEKLFPFFNPVGLTAGGGNGRREEDPSVECLPVSPPFIIY